LRSLKKFFIQKEKPEGLLMNR